MARFLEGYKPKKKKKEETVKKVQSPSVSTKTQNRAQQAQQQKTYGGNPKPQTVKRSTTTNNKNTAQQRQQTTSQQTQRTVDRLSAKYGQNRVERQEQQRRFQPNANTQRMSRNPRMLDTSGNIKPRIESRQERESRLKEAQRQKSGLNDMASKETQEVANRAIRNTPSLVKKAVKDTVSGHLQTIADITEMTASNENGTKAKAMKMGIDLNDKKQMAELEQERKRTAEQAKLDREKWAAEQDQRQQEWDKKVNGAKGGERAYYGAVESGTGMLTDLAIGLGTQGGSLAAMFSRTYGTTRGQAQKEGATEAEDRTYSFLQAAKEVGTELMFPGVGLAKGYAKKTGLPLAERVANNLTQRITNRTAADLTGAGVRLLGGTAEENLEEVAGFGLDPVIKEFSYGRAVRTRQKMADLQSESDQLRANIQSEDDARRVASYLSSSEWLDQNKQQYMDAGLNEKDAQEVAEKMRDYMTASLTGDTETMDVLEQDIASTLSKGEFSYTKSLDKTELLDTLASTTLLTMTTGLPGTATTAMRGSVIRDNLGTDGLRTLAESAMNYEDADASKRGEVARDRINSGKELTASQVYELAASQAQQVEKDTRRVVAKNNVVADTLESEKLVAPMIMRDDKGNISGDEIIIQRYNDSAQEAENALRDIDKEQKLSLSDSELAVGSRAIAGFQTGAFTINDANALNYTNTAVREAFEKVTGVDLGQYVVKTSSGAVDYAATNAATKDALFTMAADNFIETARAETENFKDIAKGMTAEQMAARVGSEGDVAISNALDTVDPADEDTYGLMASAAQNVYEYGRYTEDTWDDVSANLSEMFPGLSQEALQDVYDAAKRDKAIAENPYYNARITAGKSTRNMDMSEAEQAEYGKFTNDTGEDIGKKERTVLESIAREFNINIRLLPSEFFKYEYVDRNGKKKTAYSNGSYDPKTGTMLLNGGNDMERNIIAVALHEITHHIAIYAPDEYLALSNRVMETWYKNDADAFSRAIQRKQENYKAQVGQNLSEEQALEEVIADAMGEMSSDPDFISQICTEEPTLAEQIINAIKSVLRKLRAILASGNVSEEYEDAFFNQLGIWDDAQRLWLEAAKVAQQQRANQMIDDWDADARMTVEEQTEALSNEIEAERLSIVEDKDLIRKLDADPHINTYRAMALIDGKLYPPMASKVKDENGKWVLQQGMDIGQWVESDITTDPAMFDNKGRFLLRKDIDGTTVPAAYNPYIHSSDSMLNDQFAIAYRRPNMVVVEGEIPESELTSGYRAEHDLDDGRHVVAKDTTGITDWKAGVVQGQLSGRRTVYLTQHFKPTRIVPDSEVAQHINDKVAGTGVVIPYNVVTPSVRAELQKLGTQMAQSKEAKYYVEDAEAPVRYSIDDANIDQLDQTNSVVEDTNGEPVAEFQDNGSVRFSISSYEAKGRKIYQNYLNRMVKKGELSQQEADDMLNELETIYRISKEFANTGRFAPFTAWSNADVIYDSKGKPVFSAIKKNSEYKMNIDFSTICKKRRTLDAVFREMISRGMLERLDFNKDESAAMVVNINDLIRQHNFEAACALCFVEARRYRQQQTATTFRDMWNDLVESMYSDKSKIAYFNFGEDNTIEDVPDGIHTMDNKELDLTHLKEIANARKEDGKLVNTAEAKAARLLLKDPSQRKLMRIGDMMASTGFENMQIQNPKLMKIYNAKKGTGGAKSSFGDVQYLNEIINSKTFDRRKAYAVSGVRIQSFSDYVPRMVFDYVQVIADLAAKKLPAHAYTKEVLFARQFGLTGAKINLSLVPDVVPDGVAPGLDANGNYIWNEEGTFPYDEAMELQQAEGYKDNCGTIAVGISDEQIRKMLADPTIQMVIPYHKSSLNPIVAAMTNVDRFTNYEDSQNTKDENGKALSKDFDWDNKLFELSHDKDGNMLPKSEWGNVQDLVKEYADWCNDHNYTPKFSQFLYMEDGSINPGYYKLLEDFALLDNDGNFKPQGDVQMRFPTESDAFGSMASLIEQGLTEDAELEAKRSAEIGDIVDEIQTMIDQGTLAEQSTTSEKLAKRFSITPEMDEEYMEAVNSGNMEEAKRLVGEAAQRAGYKIHVYHGTLSEPFNRFMRPADNQYRYTTGSGFIYATPSEDYAENYAYRGEPFTEDYDEGFVMEGYMNISNLLDVGSVDDEMFSGTDFRNPDFNDEETINRLATNDLKGVAKAVNMTPYELIHYLGEEIYRDSEAVWDLVNRPKFTELIREQGHDGIKLFEWNADAYGVPEPTQIKLADAVTYAEDGSVIPLSERFNPENDDIRYSLPTEDSDGNILSDGQMEYFKNSQARDEQGRLVRVFHSTNKGGFTIFDPSFSDDKRSLFFTNFRRMSESYLKGEEPGDIDPYGDGNGNKVKRTITNVEYLPEFDTEEIAQNVRKNISDIKVWNHKTNEFIVETDDFVEAAQQIAEYLEREQAVYLAEDLFINPDKIFNDSEGAMGEAWELFRSIFDYDLMYGMRYADGKESGTYSVYLNLENPMIVDAKGSYWNVIPYDRETGTASKDDAANTINGVTLFWEYDSEGTLTGVSFSIYGETKNPDGEWEEYETGDYIENTLTDIDDLEELQSILMDDVYDMWSGTYGYDEDILTEIVGNNSDANGDVEAFFNDRYLDANGKELNVSGGTYMTRELALMAQNDGHDGVIIRNVVDYGKSGFGNEPADVYIAFSGEQVKDIRNTDPTENPDIRYSITDDEEAQSQMAYDDAMDTSYEALSYYETLIDEPEEQIELYAESFSEDKINDFYAGLNSYSEYYVFDDPVLEEGRKRMARSRADFMERLNAEWNERWLTDGEILDIRSVKKDVREMVKSIMRNADTPNKVKNDIVNKTLIDIRLAYQFAKKGRIDVADALLWHTSMRMIEGVEFVNDDTFNEYKDLRDYLRTTRIQLGEEYWSDVDYTAFRKNNFGRIKLVKGETNVDEIYQEMCERWPEWFNEEEEMTPPDQLLQIEHVLDVIQPYKEAYSSEEAASIATDIAYDLSDIVYGKGKPYESIADKYKNRYDKQTQAMRQRHEEALRKVREQREKGIKAERAKWQVREQRRKERQAHKKYFDRIVKNYDWLSERLLTNTKDKHIPEQYKKELAELLGAFDLQTVGSKKVEERRGQKGKKTIKMEAMKKAINNIEAKSEFFHLNDSITDIIDELLGREGDGSYNKLMSIEGKTIDELSVDELKKIDNLLKALKHEFTFYETVRTGAKRTQAADIGTAQVDSALEHADLFGPGKDYNNILGAADKILNMDEMTPAYLFKRIDPKNTGLGMMFRELRRSFDKYVKNQEQLNGWMEEILSPYHSGGKMWKKYGAEEIENWRRAKATNTFKLQNGDEIRLTPAQMMSVYCLAKRPQAYQHMVGAGIVVKPVTFQAKLETDLKRKTNWALPTILTDGDIKMISTALTPDQKKVADQLQQLMATKMAAWGNEASRAVIGIDLFEDPDYFPIQSDRAALEEDFTADQFVDMIRNFGFTKAVQPGARNAIAIDDIFTVVSTHCNNMNLYNAYSESMNDFMKVYNYHALREDGSDYSVKQAIAHAYSQKATTFISTFMRDLNGNVSKGRVTGIDNMMNAALGNAKKASVFANGRVALQQPTAIVRVFAVISPKYMKGIKIERGAMQEMFEHCPIALWKSWGYYDINMGKSIEDIMMNTGSWLEDKMTDIYGAADNVTWTAIWQMCKAEVKDKNPKVKEGSDEFWDLVNERMTEVVDLTQVVDSPFHRSHAMRDKQILVKMATSFMSEPTLTFNMVRDGLVNSFEMYKLGDKTGAARLLGKTSRVFALSAFATAAAAAIWDAVRGKQPDGDDDDDGTAIGLWWANTLANFQDNLKLWNDIYYIKDIASLFDGWGTSNLALQGWKQLADGYAQLTGAYRVNSKKAWWENMLAGIGYLSGTPYGTILKDGKALLNILGVHPSFLSAIGEQLDSVQDMLGGSSSGSGTGSTSSNNSSNNKKAGSDESDATSAAVRLWTYDNAPIKVEDGSAVDNFLNHFGINLTSAEIAAAEARAAQAEYQKKVDKITESLSEYSGEEYDKKLWDKQDLEGYGKALEEGDFERADEIEKLFLDCGGSQDFLDGKKLYHYKKNYVKSIVYDPTDAQIEQQTRMKDFLLSHGMTEAELSEKVYKSQTTKELKVAFCLNDEDAIVEELTPLIRAGLSYDDFVKAYKYRNRIDLKKYKDGDGKYAERLQSTGVYNWPVTGTITSHFGYRNSPGGIGSTNHKGLDIAASMGTPVGAADGGTVIFAGWDGGFGKCVRVQHDDGTITEYAHLSWWDAKVGDSVAQGQTIGNVGSTGNSTGPHLHFGVKVNGSYVDPLTKLN